MPTWLRSSGAFANITALVALVVAASGSAYAVAKVNSRDIANDSIRSIDLRDGAGVASIDVKDAPSGSDAIDANKIDGKSLAGLVVKKRDVASGRKVSNPPNSSERAFRIVRDGSLAVAARCRHGGLSDFWIDVYVEGRERGAPAPEGTRVATEDGGVTRSDDGTFRLLLTEWEDTRYRHTSFTASAPDGSRLAGTVAGGVLIHEHICVADYVIFKSA